MDFEVLKSFVGTINRTRVKNISVLGNPNQEGKQTEELYNGIAKGQFLSDKEAAEHFFQSKDEKDPKYRRLKNRLVRQLINSVFFMENEKALYTEQEKAFFNCHRDYVAAFLLISKNVKKPGIFLLHQVLEQTIKYEYTSITTEICKLLRMHYSRMIVDSNLYEKFIKLHQLYEEKRYYEMKAYDYLETLTYYFSKNRTPNLEIHEKANEYFKELEKYKTTIDTSQFYTYYYLIGVINNYSKGCYKKVVFLCQEALDILLSRKVVKKSSILYFKIQKLGCVLQLRLFSDFPCEDQIKSCLKESGQGDFNWFRVKEYSVYHSLIQKDYPQALSLLEESLQHPSFKSLEGIYKENWDLLKGYIYFLCVLGKIPEAVFKEKFGPFRPSKFANQFKYMEKEKDGMNIPVLLLPVLLGLAQGKYDEYGRSAEALEKYRQRYLETDLNRRSACFFKLLLALANKPYDPAGSERKIRKELAVLAKLKPEDNLQNFTIEVIPYEDIWEMISAFHPERLATKKQPRQVETSRGRKSIS